MKVLVVGARPDRAEVACFAGLRQRGVEVEVMCEPGAPNRGILDAAGVPVTPLKIGRRLSGRAVRAIRGRLDAGGSDILHLLTRRTVRNGLAAARGRDVRIVAYRGVSSTPLGDPSNWITYLHPRVDRIVCVSEAVRRDLLEQRFLWWRVPPDKPVTIHKGHDVAWYDERPIDLATVGVPEDAFTVGFLANLRPGKGLRYLVESAVHLPSDSRVHYVLIGRGTDGRRVASRIRRTGAAHRFHALGHRAEGRRWIAACDALAHPSLAEGLSRVVIEAMAYRTPPIVTPASGDELVEPGVSGLVVPPEDPRALAGAIRDLETDPTRRRRMGEAARERIRTAFPVERTVEKTLALYDDLMNPSKRSHG